MNLRARVGRHLAVCAVAATASAASADVVYFGNQNLIINSDFNGLYLNILTGDYNTTGGGGSSVPGGWHINPYGSTGLSWYQSGSNGVGYMKTASGQPLSNLAVGTLIDSSAFFSGGGASTNLTLNGESIVGFRFTLSGGTHYGWFRVSLSDTYAGQPRSIVDWAYESTAGGGIDAGAIPAPGAIALLGMAGLAGSRRRRG